MSTEERIASIFGEVAVDARLHVRDLDTGREVALGAAVRRP